MNKKIILTIIFLILICFYLIAIHPTTKTIIGKWTIESKAVQESASLSITIMFTVSANIGTFNPSTINESQSIIINGTCTPLGGTLHNAYMILQDNQTGVMTTTPNSANTNKIYANASYYNLGNISSATTALFNITSINAGIYNFTIQCNGTEAAGNSTRTLLTVQGPVAPPPEIPSGGGAGPPSRAARIEEIPIYKPGLLFNISLIIPEKYRKLPAGEKLVAEINIISIKLDIVNVNIEYYIKDMNKNIVFKENETKVIENEITYIKEIMLPAELDSGQYTLFVKIVYDDDITLVGHPFEIISPEEPFLYSPAISKKHIYWIGILLFVILLILIMTLVKYIKKEKVKYKR